MKRNTNLAEFVTDIFTELRRRIYESDRTPEQIAEGTGIGQTTIYRIIRGDVSPTLATAQKIFDHLGGVQIAVLQRKAKKPFSEFLQEHSAKAAS